MVLTQKETSLLKDLRSQEQICVDKYNRYSSQACDKQLSQLFSSIGQTEQQHVSTIDQIMSGAVPSMSSGQQQAASPSITPAYNNQAAAQNQTQNKNNDAYLCSDALSTEKHVSSVYNTSIFEFKDPALRNVLNHIQKEEQEHGKKIYDYMSVNGMYS
jgi:spore coat protein CotF